MGLVYLRCVNCFQWCLCVRACVLACVVVCDFRGFLIVGYCVFWLLCCCVGGVDRKEIGTVYAKFLFSGMLFFLILLARICIVGFFVWLGCCVGQGSFLLDCSKCVTVDFGGGNCVCNIVGITSIVIVVSVYSRFRATRAIRNMQYAIR